MSEEKEKDIHVVSRIVFVFGCICGILSFCIAILGIWSPNFEQMFETAVLLFLSWIIMVFFAMFYRVFEEENSH